MECVSDAPKSRLKQNNFEQKKRTYSSINTFAKPGNSIVSYIFRMEIKQLKFSQIIEKGYIKYKKYFRQHVTNVELFLDK